MKFSVLLPTRNRSALLQYAVESVRRQDYPDWEIVVSDNASTDDTVAYVHALNDPRVRLVRTTRFVPVTDNWNNALANSRGDYVVMLGDDDCILPGYFDRLAALLEDFGSPDHVYVEAIQFAYPGVMPGHSKAFTQIGYSELLRDRTSPGLLDRDEILAAVRKSMALRLSFSYNMQHSLISRRLIDRLAGDGPFFQSPYPDYYASNVALLAAERVLAVPEPLVGIGISPMSFGAYYFSGQIDEGVALLNNRVDIDLPQAVTNSLLPGNPLFTSWYLAMAQIEKNYGRKYGLTVDTRRYRLLQVVYGGRQRGVRSLLSHWSRLNWPERVVAVGIVTWLHALPRMLPATMARRLTDPVRRWVSPFPTFDARIETVDYQTILDLFEARVPPRGVPARLDRAQGAAE